MEDMDYRFNEIMNYQRNTIKLNAMNKSTYVAGEQIEFQLPSNALLDLSTFAVHLDVQIVAASSTQVVAPPNGVESFWDRVQCTTKGVALENAFNNYNLLHKLLLVCTTDQSVETGQRSVYALGGQPATGTGDTTITGLVCSSWLGFLGSAGTVWTGNEMLGDLRVNITTATNDVLSAVGGGATYQLNNVFATVDRIQGGEMLQAMLSSIKQQPMMAFDNYGAYSQTGQSNVKFSVNSSHLNKVLVTLRNATGLGQGAQLSSTKDAPFFKFERRGADNHQILIGDTLYPTYQARGNTSALYDVMKAFGKQKDISIGSLINSANYLTERYCLAYNFEHLGSSALSGIDTRNIATGCQWSANTLTTADTRVDIFPIYKSIVAFSSEGVQVMP